MRKLLLTLCACLAPGLAAAQGVPSGQPLALWEIRWERVEGTDAVQVILRAIAPQIARDSGTVDYDGAQADMDWLCANHGLTLADMPYGRATQVIVNLMDSPIPRGQTNPSVTQFYSAYSIQDDTCIWEDF